MFAARYLDTLQEALHVRDEEVVAHYLDVEPPRDLERTPESRPRRAAIFD